MAPRVTRIYAENDADVEVKTTPMNGANHETPEDGVEDEAGRSTESDVLESSWLLVVLLLLLLLLLFRPLILHKIAPR